MVERAALISEVVLAGWSLIRLPAAAERREIKGACRGVMVKWYETLVAIGAGAAGAALQALLDERAHLRCCAV